VYLAYPQVSGGAFEHRIATQSAAGWTFSMFPTTGLAVDMAVDRSERAHLVRSEHGRGDADDRIVHLYGAVSGPWATETIARTSASFDHSARIAVDASAIHVVYAGSPGPHVSDRIVYARRCPPS
jgi:hypothetical protein